MVFVFNMGIMEPKINYMREEPSVVIPHTPYSGQKWVLNDGEWKRRITLPLEVYGRIRSFSG